MLTNNDFLKLGMDTLGTHRGSPENVLNMWNDFDFHDFIQKGSLTFLTKNG